MRTLSLLVLPLALFACQSSVSHAEPNPEAAPKPEVPAGHQVATFAGGCFWCMEPPFDKVDGVVSTTSGYAGGKEQNPRYGDVARGRTGHTEVVQVVFDPEKVSYQRLAEVFWHNIDPLAEDRQFCDGGAQYRTAIFFHDDAQKKVAETTKADVAKKFAGKTIHTEITRLDAFWPAETYHQDFYKKKPGHYQRYRQGCGRDARLKALWGEKAGK